VVVSADTGAGYLNQGEDGFGAYSTLLANMDLPRLRPSIVIVQGGYNDAGSNPFAVAAAVVSLVGTIRQEAPRGATLVVMGSFDADVAGSPTPPVDAVNSTILDAAQSVDPKPVIMDPLTSDWEFARASDNLHPTAAGSRTIANYAALALSRAVSSGTVSFTRSTDPRPRQQIGPGGYPTADRLPGRRAMEWYRRNR
jgi:lysophospholipase L1-like esterase